MPEPLTALTGALDSANKVASNNIVASIIDRVTGFKLSKWAAQGEIMKKHLHENYEIAKQNGLGIEYVNSFRSGANIINTLSKSSKFIDASKNNDITIDNDFFWNLLDHAKGISNEEMQEFIAKIIAGEYNNPGSYSVSTLQIIKMLGKTELELFEKICGLIIDVEYIPGIVFSTLDLMTQFEIDFSSFQQLQSLSLFLPNPMSNNIKNPDKKNFQINYFDKQILFSPINLEDDNTLNPNIPSNYGLSPIGKQLIRHLNPEYSEKYFMWLKENYKIPNYQIIKQ